MLSKKKKDTTIVGLDIGSANIRGVQVSFKNGVPTVEKVGEIALKPDVINDEGITDKDSVAEAIKTLWKSYKFDTNIVRLGVGGDKVVSRLAELDWENDQDFGLLLPSLIREHLAIVEPRDYVIDFHTLSEYMQRRVLPTDNQNISYRGTRNRETQDISVPKKHALIVAAPKSLVRSYVDVSLEAGLKPISVDIKSLAILRAYSADRASAEERLADVSIDIGASSTVIIIHTSGQPLFTRVLSGHGGRNITQRLQDELSLGFIRAEKRKMNVFFEELQAKDENVTSEDWSFGEFGSSNDSLLEVEDAVRGSVPRTDAEEEAYDLAIAEAQEHVNQQVALLLDEIRSTLTWFTVDAGSVDFDGFDKFVLTGAGAGIPNLVERLSDEYKTPAVLGTPLTFQAHKVLPEGIISTEYEYATAYGLAIGQGSSHD